MMCKRVGLRTTGTGKCSLLQMIGCCPLDILYTAALRAGDLGRRSVRLLSCEPVLSKQFGSLLYGTIRRGAA